MKLTNYELESSFEIEPSTVNVLVVEREDMFFRYCSELREQVEGHDGDFRLSDNGESLRISKYFALIDDYFCIDVNDRKITGRLHQCLREIIEDKLMNELDAISQAWAAMFDKLNSESPCELDYNDEDIVSAYLKSFGVKIFADEDTLLQRILKYMDIMGELFGIKGFIFFNLKTVLTEKEVTELYKECSLNDYCVLLLENTYKYKIEPEKITLIDRDLCEITV